MRRNFVVLFSLVGSMLSSNVFAAGDVCVELIRHAVYDRTAGSGQTASYEESKRKFCTSSENITDNKQRANTGASYGVISGFGDFSASQKKEARAAMCDDSYSQSRFSNNRQIFVESLNPFALSAVDNCIRAASQGLQFKTVYPDDDTMVVSLLYVPQAGENPKAYRKFNGRPTIPAELKCTGKITEADEGTHIDNNSTDMTCHRAGPLNSIKLGDRQIVHGGGSVVISTTAGALIAFLAKKPDPNFKIEPPKPILPTADQQVFDGQTPNVNAGEISNASNFKNGTNLAYGWSIRGGPLAGDALYLGVTPNKNAGMVNTIGANWRGGQTIPFGYVIAPGKQGPSDKPLYVGLDSRCAGAVANNPGHQGCAMRLLGFAYVPGP